MIACQENTFNERVEKTYENENESYINSINKFDLTKYDEVKDNYARFTEISIDDIDNITLEFVKMGAIDYFYRSNEIVGIFYTHFDINNDETEELLIGLRNNEGTYELIDLYTIINNEVISLFDDNMSTASTYKRSSYMFSNTGKLIYTTASGSGEKYGIIYELQDEVGAFEKVYEVTTENGDFSIIKKELVNALDINELNWEIIGNENQRTVYDQFLTGDFTAIEGFWKNSYDHEGSLVKIKGNTLTYENGDQIILEFVNNYSNETFIVFNLIDQVNMSGASLYFYPAHSEIDWQGTIFPSEVEKDRIFVTQTEPPSEEGIYYKVGDPDD